jgi:hypothetical protein
MIYVNLDPDPGVPAIFGGRPVFLILGLRASVRS